MYAHCSMSIDFLPFMHHTIRQGRIWLTATRTGLIPLPQFHTKDLDSNLSDSRGLYPDIRKWLIIFAKVSEEPGNIIFGSPVSCTSENT